MTEKERQNLGNEEMQRERDLTEKVDRFYKDFLNEIHEIYNFDFIPNEAVYLKKIIRDVFLGNEGLEGTDSDDLTIPKSEIIDRFLFGFYGINHVDGISNGSVKISFREIFEMIKKKYRPEGEMLENIPEEQPKYDSVEKQEKEEIERRVTEIKNYWVRRLKEYDYDLSMGEAAFIARRAREIMKMNKQTANNGLNCLAPDSEAFNQYLVTYWGIDIQDKQFNEIGLRDIVKVIQKTLRPEKEML